jgi:hypothetical protein
MNRLVCELWLVFGDIIFVDLMGHKNLHFVPIRKQNNDLLLSLR